MAEGFKEMIKKYVEEIALYEEMSVVEKIERLSQLKEESRELEKRLADVSFHKSILKRMPDVAGHMAVRDEIAMALLQEIKEKEKTTYRGLMESYDNFGKVIIHYIDFLRRAEFIELIEDPSHPGDEIIRLTTKGKDVRYLK